MKASILFLLLLSSFTDSSFAQVGSLDQNFGTNGKILINRKSSGVGSICLQQDGKIILTGNCVDTTNVTNPNGIFLTRYTPNGQTDSSFGINGIVNNYITPFKCLGGKAAIQKDEKIVVASYISGYVGQDYQWGLGAFRFLNDGNINSSFGINGLIF